MKNNVNSEPKIATKAKNVGAIEADAKTNSQEIEEGLYENDS